MLNPVDDGAPEIFWIDRLDTDARQIRQPCVAKDPNRLMGVKLALIAGYDPLCVEEGVRSPRGLWHARVCGAGMLPSRDLPDLGIVLPVGNSVLNHQTFAMTISQWRSPQNHTEFAQACLGDSASPY